MLPAIGVTNDDALWPRLPIAEWQDTRDTLHMLTQMVGKIRLRLCPRQNHYWHVTLMPTPRGLATPPIPFGARTLEIRLDLVGSELALETSDGARHAIPLRSAPIAELHRELVGALRGLGVEVAISTLPSEVAHAIPFDRDTTHRTYDPRSARRFGAVLVQASRVLERFRGGFLGKSSPVHFFWGGFDLALTRFSGRRAPEHVPVPFTPLEVVREAYSHEVASVGFWPGDGAIDACFYAYAYPEPPGYRGANVSPREARFEPALGEWILPYESVRTSADPDAAILAFAESTYRAAAELAGWDRASLERRAAAPRSSRPSVPARLSDAGAGR